MADNFKYDVFLSHSSKDKAVVRELAAWLERDGVRVWLDEKQIGPGDNILAKIEEGLEYSRVLVFCMSANAFDADWAQLETGTFRFRDPKNKDRRFVPIRLDDAPIKGSLAQFLYLNWYPAYREFEYQRLLYFLRETTFSNPSLVPKSPGPHENFHFSNIKPPPPNAVQPLHIAEERYLQILLSRFVLKRHRESDHTAIELSLQFDDDTRAIWDQEGKRYLWNVLSEDKRKRYQRILDDFIIGGIGTDTLDIDDPEFFFRYVSGGTLPIVHFENGGNSRAYYCLFYRDIHPIGWNIANGGSDTRAELLNPEETINRELREELIIADFDKKERHIFSGSKPLDHPAHAAARRLWKRKFPDLDLSTLKEIPVRLDWERGPDSLTITMGKERQRTRSGFFLNINGLDFGIECDRVAHIYLPGSAHLFDGEIDAGRLVYCPVGLFDVRRFTNTPQTAPQNFQPDFFFFGDKRFDDGSSITNILKSDFIAHVRPIRTEDQIAEVQKAIESNMHCYLCPATERIIKRYINYQRRIV